MTVYLIVNRVTGQQYVGTTIRSARVRFSDHLTCAFNRLRPQPLYVAMREHGRDAFTIEVLHEVDTYEEMLAREMDEIACRQTIFPHGYNLVKGGRGNYGWKMSDETRQKIAAKVTGRKAWNKGIPNSPEARAKMSAVRKGKVSAAQLAVKRKAATDPESQRKRSETKKQKWAALTDAERAARLEQLAQARKVRAQMSMGTASVH